MKIEYKVRPVTRYIVTKYVEDGRGGSCSCLSEYDNDQVAYEVAYALAKEELNRLGLPLGDETVMFPDPAGAPRTDSLVRVLSGNEEA